MSKYYFYNGQLYSEEELKHYGVLGMKWGVRRNPQRALARATRKMIKLDRKASVAVDKARKAREKADTAREKADNATRSMWGFKRVKANDLQKRANELEMTASELSRIANKRVRKAANWYRDVSKVMGEKLASAMTDDEGTDMGRRYADYYFKERFK